LSGNFAKRAALYPLTYPAKTLSQIDQFLCFERVFVGSFSPGESRRQKMLINSGKYLLNKSPPL